MAHRHNKTFYPIPPEKSKSWHAIHEHTEYLPSQPPVKPKLDIVLKCDSAGSLEAVSASILSAASPDVDVHIIHSSVGDIRLSDILIAETGSRLIAGFQISTPSSIDKELKDHGVEARLYDVIYHVAEDIRGIAQSLAVRAETEDTIIGNARVVALFKSSRKGIIIGCDITKGYLAVGQHFRIISAMGPVYSGTVESMHSEDRAVQKATAGQKVGIKIRDFNKVKTGDIVESFRPSPSRPAPVWKPVGGVLRI